MGPVITVDTIQMLLFWPLFIWFCCDMHTLGCIIWDLVPWAAMEPRPPGLGAQSLSPWTTTGVPDSSIIISSIQLLRCVRLLETPWTAARQASLSITNSRSLLKLTLVMPSNRLILCHPLLPPSMFPSIRVFSNESALPIRGSKDWSFSFSTSPSNEYSGLIPFRTDWLDLLAVQGILKSLLQMCVHTFVL